MQARRSPTYRDSHFVVGERVVLARTFHGKLEAVACRARIRHRHGPVVLFPSKRTLAPEYVRCLSRGAEPVQVTGFSRLRLCKGAHKEPTSVAYQGKVSVDDAYLR